MGARLINACKTSPPSDYNTITPSISPCSFGRVVMRDLIPCKWNSATAAAVLGIAANASQEEVTAHRIALRAR
jgi:hypothetical protein